VLKSDDSEPPSGLWKSLWHSEPRRPRAAAANANVAAAFSSDPVLAALASTPGFVALPSGVIPTVAVPPHLWEQRAYFDTKGHGIVDFVRIHVAERNLRKYLGTAASTVKLSDADYRRMLLAGAEESGGCYYNCPGLNYSHDDHHGFVEAVLVAYNNHNVLRLRPDDVWLTVSQVSKELVRCLR
jgi:hypothetical protein